MRVVGLLLLLSAGLAASGEEKQVDWVGDWAEAFRLAKETGQPVMLCINSKDGESASDRAAKKTYHDVEFVAMSRKFVMMVVSTRSHWPKDACPRFGKITCEQHLNCWKALRQHHAEQFMASAMSGTMISPQHAWFRPDGTLLRRKEYELSKAELLQRMRRVLAEVDKKPGVEVPDNQDPTSAPLDDKDKAELHRVVTGDKEARRAALGNLLATEKVSAHLALVALVGETRKVNVKCDTLRAFGRAQVKDARPMIEERLAERDPLVRSFAAVALEDLGDPGSIGPLLKRAKREKDTDARKNMYRAMGVCGGPAANKDVAKFLLKAMKSDKQNANRKHAAYSLRTFTTDEGRKLVVKPMEKALKGTKDYYVRGGIIYALAHIGNTKTTLPIFEKILGGTRDRWGKMFVRSAIRRLKGEASEFGRSARFLLAEDRDDPARQD